MSHRLRPALVALVAAGSLALPAGTAVAAGSAPSHGGPSSSAPQGTSPTGMLVDTIRGKQVYVSLSGTGAVVQVGKNRSWSTYTSPVGQPVVSGYRDGHEHVWIDPLDGTLVDWTLDVVHGTVRQRTLTDVTVHGYAGDRGILVEQAASATDPTRVLALYNAMGEQVFVLPTSEYGNIAWMTTTAFYLRTASGVVVYPLDASEPVTYDLGLPVTRVDADNAGTTATVTYIDATGATQTCVLSETSSTCPVA